MTLFSENATELNDAIVITGAGLVCALGLNKTDVWNAVIGGTCGIGRLTAIEQSDQCSKGGGQAPELPPGLHDDLPREVRYLRSVIQEALAESKFLTSAVPAHRCGVVLGTTLAGMRSAGTYFRTGELGHLRQFTAASTLQLAIDDLPISGFATTTCSACASGLSSIALAITLLRCGQLDLVIAGGYDTLSEYAYAGFNSLRLVTDGPPMPFSKDRQGMKLGEGYGVVVLEKSVDATRRGVMPLARILGFGESSDAHHLTQPHPQGKGASRAMQAALRGAELDARHIDMIAAHATATPNNDAAEYNAYHQVFGDNLRDIPVVAFKSYLGHTLGGAGTVELILSMLSIRNQCVPATLHVATSNVEFPGLRVLDQSIPAPIERTMNVSMGFGGANACVILGRAESMKSVRIGQSNDPARDVMITGIGIIAPSCIGNEEFLNGLNGSGQPSQVASGIEDSQIEHLINARRVRRMSEFAKLVLAATTVAIKDAGIEDVDAFAASCSAILGTTHGAINFSEQYYRQIVEQGIDAANPMLFAEGVPNVGSAQLSLMLNILGSTQTIVGTCTAGLDALCLAMWRIQSGAWDRAIVAAAEERHSLIDMAYTACENDRDLKMDAMSSSSGAVALVLECRAEVQRRAVRARGIVINGRGQQNGIACPQHRIGSIKQLHRQLGHSDGEVDLACVDRILHASFSVLPLAKVVALLLKGTSGMRQNIIAQDPNGFSSGVAIAVT